MNYKYFLTIDIGNTNTTCSLYNNDKTVYFSIKELDKFKTDLKLTPRNTKTLVSSVNKNIHDNLNDLNPIFIKDHFKDNFFFTMPVNYNETVGLDRLACAFYAFNNKMSATIIDTGSFTTVDSVDSKGFNGGYILPGLKVLQDSYKQGSLLSEFKPIILSESTIPKRSEDAINSGLTESFVAPILSIVSKYKNEKILLTGGNADFLTMPLESQIDKHLIHRSMQIILKDYL